MLLGSRTPRSYLRQEAATLSCPRRAKKQQLAYLRERWAGPPPPPKIGKHFCSSKLTPLFSLKAHTTNKTLASRTGRPCCVLTEHLHSPGYVWEDAFAAQHCFRCLPILSSCLMLFADFCCVGLLPGPSLCSHGARSRGEPVGSGRRLPRPDLARSALLDSVGQRVSCRPPGFVSLV